MLALIAFWLLCTVGSGILAHDKGRDTVKWGLAGVLIGPMAVFLILVTPAKQVARCRFCHGKLPAGTVAKCQHCGK